MKRQPSCLLRYKYHGFWMKLLPSLILPALLMKPTCCRAVLPANLGAEGSVRCLQCWMTQLYSFTAVGVGVGPEPIRGQSKHHSSELPSAIDRHLSPSIQLPSLKHHNSNLPLLIKFGGAARAPITMIGSDLSLSRRVRQKLPETGLHK